MNGFWIGASKSKPACLFEDVTLLKEWILEYKNLIDEEDVTVVDKVLIFILFSLFYLCPSYMANIFSNLI